MDISGHIEGQLNEVERRLLVEAITTARPKPRTVIEVGTWLGGGSTIHILRALEQNGEGHLCGIEADSTVYAQMVENIRRAAPESFHRFTPLFGYSQDVLPKWIAEHGPGLRVDFVFLDGGNNPLEQIVEFKLLDPYIPVGGQLMAHDAKLRKGKWLVPYLSLLDNWAVTLHDVSPEGLLHARKTAVKPSPPSARRAQTRLAMLRCNPVEIAAQILPARVCGLLLGLLPRRLSRGLSDGRWNEVG